MHLLPDEHEHEHEHDVAALEAWHDAEHRHGHEKGEHEEEGPAPSGLMIELPELVAAAPRSSTVIPSAGVQTLAALPFSRWHLALVESSIRTGPIRSGWPPRETTRSGVAALLRSSHAILI